MALGGCGCRDIQRVSFPKLARGFRTKTPTNWRSLPPDKPTGFVDLVTLSRIDTNLPKASGCEFAGFFRSSREHTEMSQDPYQTPASDDTRSRQKRKRTSPVLIGLIVTFVAFLGLGSMAYLSLSVSPPPATLPVTITPPLQAEAPEEPSQAQAMNAAERESKRRADGN